MKTTRTLFSVISLIAVVIVIVVSARAKGAKTLQVQNVPLLKAGFPGGVERLVMADLMAMQKGSYILHVRDGKVTKVPAEKSILPSAPRAWSSQGIVVSKADDDTVYVRQDKIMCKSTDGGRTWTSHPDPSVDQSRFQVLSDGSLISVFATHGPGNTGPAAVHLSRDEGRTWEKIAEIPIQVPGFEYTNRYLTWPIYRLPDDTLLWGIQLRNDVHHVKGRCYGPNGTFTYEKGWVAGNSIVFLYRSSDGGRTWEGPFKTHDWTSEGGMTILPSGKLLATIRHQRCLLPSDPRNLTQQVDEFSGGIVMRPTHTQVYKHVFLIESADRGKTWTNLRMLTRAKGQCYGFPVSLGGGTVVVIHTSPYAYARPRSFLKPPQIEPQQKLISPGVPSARAVISHDEGRTWEDEAYYVYFGKLSGYNQSVVMKDGTILTIAALDDKQKVAIRWKLLKKGSITQAKETRTGPAPKLEANSGPADKRETSTWSANKRARMKVATRKRRVIFNDDMYELDRTWSNTPEGLLSGRITPLLGTQVDTISFSIIEADAPVYDSKVQPIYGEAAHGEDPPYWPNIGPNIKALAKLGQCPIQIYTDYAHKHDMEAWAHMRMNDAHDSFVKGWLSLWKKEHRELLVERKGMLADKNLYNYSKDFTHEECRQRNLEILEEVAGRYDIDGFELDYIRHPVLFSRTMRGEPVTQEEVQIMTSFMRQIRTLSDEAAARRGRPIVIASRVPDTLIKSMDIGLDVRTWVQEDLIDILIIGGGYSPYILDLTEYIDIARPYGVTVYPCLTPPKYAPANRRALAARWLQAGADGIYLWNLGSPFEYFTDNRLIEQRTREYACLTEIGDPKTLAGKDKEYHSGYHKNGKRVNKNYHFVSGYPLLPLTLKPGDSQKIPMRIGDDVEAAARAGQIKRLPLEVCLKGTLKESSLSITLNGQRLAGGERIVLDAEDSTFMMRYQLSAPPLKVGQNIIEVSSAEQGRPDAKRAGAAAFVTLLKVRLLVDYQ